MSRYTDLSLAIAFASAASFCQASIAATPSYTTLLVQADGLPKEFHEHFFDVPLAVRVMLDNQVLGEAMVVLSRDERMTLIEFTDTRDSDISPAEREVWQLLLQQGVVLGPCASQCAEDLLAVHSASTTQKSRYLPAKPSAKPSNPNTTPNPRAVAGG